MPADPPSSGRPLPGTRPSPGRAGGRFVSLQTKLLVGTLLVVASVMSALVVIVEHRQREAIIREVQRRGDTLARDLAVGSTGPLVLYNYTQLEQNVARVATETDVAYAMILDRDGRVAAHNHRPEIVGTLLSGGTLDRILSTDATLAQETLRTGRGGALRLRGADPGRRPALGHGPGGALAPPDGGGDRSHAAPVGPSGRPRPGRGGPRVGPGRPPDRAARPAAGGRRGRDLAGGAGPAGRADDAGRDRAAGDRLQRDGAAASRAALGAPRAADGARGGPRGAPPPVCPIVRPEELHRSHSRLAGQRDRHPRSRWPRGHPQRRRRSAAGLPGRGRRPRPARRGSPRPRPRAGGHPAGGHSVADGPHGHGELAQPDGGHARRDHDGHPQGRRGPGPRGHRRGARSHRCAGARGAAPSRPEDGGGRAARRRRRPRLQQPPDRDHRAQSAPPAEAPAREPAPARRGAGGGDGAAGLRPHPAASRVQPEADGRSRASST